MMEMTGDYTGKVSTLPAGQMMKAVFERFPKICGLKFI